MQTRITGTRWHVTRRLKEAPANVTQAEWGPTIMMGRIAPPENLNLEEEGPASASTPPPRRRRASA